MVPDTRPHELDVPPLPDEKDLLEEDGAEVKNRVEEACESDTPVEDGVQETSVGDKESEEGLRDVEEGVSSRRKTSRP